MAVVIANERLLGSPTSKRSRFGVVVSFSIAITGTHPTSNTS